MDDLIKCSHWEYSGFWTWLLQMARICFRDSKPLEVSVSVFVFCLFDSHSGKDQLMSSQTSGFLIPPSSFGSCHITQNIHTRKGTRHPQHTYWLQQLSSRNPLVLQDTDPHREGDRSSRTHQRCYVVQNQELKACSQWSKVVHAEAGGLQV